MIHKKVGLLVLGACVAILGCGAGGELADEEQLAQTAGDIGASVDEASQGSGLALNDLSPKEIKGVPGFMQKNLLEKFADAALPAAYADACFGTAAFSACSNGQRTRTFANCTVGGATLNGTVTLTFSESACTMSATGDSVRRDANFTIANAKGTFTVASPNGGQTLTRTDAGFTYKVGGIERSAVDSGGTTRFDFVTKTLEDISITGTSRANRELNGGKFEVEHKLAGYTIDWVPDAVKWTSGCNCPTSGKLTGTVVSGTSGKTATVEFTGCGTGTLTTDKGTKTFNFDRCSQL